MKVFITGGGGFIGSTLADHLLARGDEVVVLDNFATGRHDNLVPRDRLEIVEGSITTRDLVNDLVTSFRPDVVVHAAASYKDPDDWHTDAMVNTVGTVNVVHAARAAGVSRFIYFQTALCYGLKPEQQPVSLDHPLNPGASSYAISKTAGEQYIQLSGLDYISFRLANAYGPRNISGPLPTFYHRLTTEKPCFVMDTRRDFIYIDDLVDCVLRAVVNGQGRGIYHISSGADVSIEELFDAAVGALGITLRERVEVRPKSEEDAFTILLDPSRTNDEFGWFPSTPLDVGVQHAIDYYRKFGIGETFTHLRGPEEEPRG